MTRIVSSKLNRSALTPPRKPVVSPRRSVGTKGNRHAATSMAGEDRYRMVAEAAYYRAEQRGFAPGAELDDWLGAEVEVDALLADAGGPAP